MSPRGEARLKDRTEAGRLLAAELIGRPLERPVVLGLPRGGVVVAAEVARALGAPLDVLIVRKIGCPGQPEYGLGAIAETGEVLYDDDRIAELGLTRESLADVVARERREAERRRQMYRRGRGPVDVRGRTVIAVDDGVATGGTARLALRVLALLGAARRVFAVGVAPPEAIRALEREADLVVCLRTPPEFYAVGEWYEQFDPVDDDEVIRSLAVPGPTVEPAEAR